MIRIDLPTQTLTFQGRKYVVSTSAKGAGEKNGSFCTPRGVAPTCSSRSG